jgi:predicted nucleotidyltransferase
MTNTSKKTYKELSWPYYKDVFLILDIVCNELGIEYYLIGAQARNFHLLESGIEPSRGTKDIDFAVMLPEMESYDKMKNLLISKGFREVKEPYRLIHDQSDTVIDLLPFGEIEEEGTVKFTDRITELSVIGMKEVNEYTIAVDFEEITIKVSPLEGIVILKLISYSEKPERRKDLDDISEILTNYFDINDTRFYEEHMDVLDELQDEDFIILAGARLMGRDMKKILSVSEKLSKQIETIINNELQEKTGGITQYFLSQNYFKDYYLIKNIFLQLLKGIKE